MGTLKAGGIGAAGALLNNLLYGYTNSYLPAAITGNPMLVSAWQALQAILLGIGARKVVPRYATDLANGAMAVVLYNFAHAQLAAAMPTLPLSGMGAYLTVAPAYRGSANFPYSAGVDNNPTNPISTTLRQPTYTAVGRMGRVGRIGRTGRVSGMRGMSMGKYLTSLGGGHGFGDTTFGNGIPTG